MDRNTVTSTQSEALVNADGRQVLRNTYGLLAITLLFSAAMAYLAAMLQVSNISPLLLLVGAYGLMFLVHKTAHSAFGLVAILAFTGFMGFTLGPILSVMMHSARGAGVVMMALGTTGAAFLGLSLFALMTRRDLSGLSSFITVGVFVLLAGMICNMFMHMSALSMMVSCGFVLLSSAIILFKTQQIIRGGEDNYILATISLYVSIYNLFVSLLQLLSPRN